MPESLSIEQALKRLESALDRLEIVVERRAEKAGTISGFESELQRLGADRSRLAQSLDAAEERAARLAETNAEVSRGLVEAMETIRDVLSRHDA
jgi:chromosome segregation ATPase